MTDEDILKLMRRVGRPLEDFEPGEAENCFCGRQITFKDCCKGKYDSSSYSIALESANKGDMETAKTHMHRWITWYRLSHYAHTVPAVNSNPILADEILLVDIEALGGALSELYKIYFLLGQTKLLREVYERLKNSIADERWHNKIIFHLAFWKLLWLKDVESAVNTIKKIDIEKCHDPDVLGGFLQLNSKNMSLEKKLVIVDRIINGTTDSGIILQYTLLRGLYLCLVNEMEEGILLIKTAIDKYKTNNQNRTEYGDHQLAESLKSLGELTENKSLFIESKNEYLKLLEKDYFNSFGKAEILKDIGHCCRYLEEYKSAQKYYEKSLTEYDSDVTKIFLAESLTLQNEIKRSAEVLEKLRGDTFDEGERYDFSFAWAHLGLISRKEEHVSKAKDLLKKIKVNEPLFMKQRDEILISLLESETKSTDGKWRKSLKFVNDYLLIKPAFFGIGINGNKILDDLTNKRKKK